MFAAHFHIARFWFTLGDYSDPKHSTHDVFINNLNVHDEHGRKYYHIAEKDGEAFLREYAMEICQKQAWNIKSLNCAGSWRVKKKHQSYGDVTERFW